MNKPLLKVVYKHLFNNIRIKRKLIIVVKFRIKFKLIKKINNNSKSKMSKIKINIRYQILEN